VHDRRFCINGLSHSGGSRAIAGELYAIGAGTAKKISSDKSCEIHKVRTYSTGESSWASR